MNTLPAFPPIQLRDGTVLVASQSADTVRAALVADTLAELRDAASKGWCVFGHAATPDFATEAIDTFALGITRLDALRWTAMQFASEGQAEFAGRVYMQYAEAALQHAAESLVDMMDDGFRITFGPLQ